MTRLAPFLLLAGCADLIGITDERRLEMVTLAASAGVLEPAFDPAIVDYDLALAYDHVTVELHAEANDPQAAIEIAGMPSIEGKLAVAVPIGDLAIDVVARTPSDVVVTYKVRVHRGDLAIAFAAPRAVPTQLPGMISQISVADFDGNGSDDVAVSGTGNFGVLTNNGAAQFTPKAMLWLGDTRAFTARDLDEDGKPEVIATADQVKVARGYGDGFFDAAYSSFPAGTFPGAFAFFRLDADARPDLVVADQHGRLTILQGVPPVPGAQPGFTPLPALDQQVGPNALTAVAAGELDGAPGDDVASLDPVAGKIYIHRNFGGGLGLETLDLGLGAQPLELIAVDLDGDQRAELVWIDAATSSVVVQPYGGPRGSTHHVAGAPRSLVAIDLDGDGVRDLLVRDDQGVTVLHNDGTGTLFQKSIPISMQDARQLAVGDFNGDGRADLVTCNFTSTVLVHLGTP